MSSNQGNPIAPTGENPVVSNRENTVVSNRENIVSKSPNKQGQGNEKEITNQDLNKLVQLYLDEHPFGNIGKNSFNDFLNTGLEQIICHLFNIEANISNKSGLNPEIAGFKILVNFTDAKIMQPYVSHTSGNTEVIRECYTPQIARRNASSFTAPLIISIQASLSALDNQGNIISTKNTKIDSLRLDEIPIPSGCDVCPTSIMTQTEKFMAGEDPLDCGGQFIIGSEWIINSFQSRTFNMPHIFRNVGFKNELVRLEFISRPGNAFENSSELIIRYITDFNLNVSISSHEYLKVIEIPFYLIFRLMGMVTDEEIFNNIVLAGYSNRKGEIDARVSQALKQSFQVQSKQFAKLRYITDEASLVEEISRIIVEKSMNISIDLNSDKQDIAAATMIKDVNYKLLGLLDRYLLPHIGMTPSSRHLKLRYLGQLIYKVYLVYFGVLSSTDRDMYANMRVATPGHSYSKIFKTTFNLAIVTPTKKAIMEACNKQIFAQIDLEQVIRGTIRGVNLEKALDTIITTGEKTANINNTTLDMKNKFNSEQLTRKNHLFIGSAVNTIKLGSRTVNNKQTSRALEQRSIQPDQLLGICPFQSQDSGPYVGLNKQISIATSITRINKSDRLRKMLSEDPMVIDINKVFPNQIAESGLAKVLINGYWLGCTKNMHLLALKYRELRRGYKPVTELITYQTMFKQLNEPQIDPDTTIEIDVYTNEIIFWTDPGRMASFVIIVRNNGETDSIGRELIGSKYDPITNTGFKQHLMLTNKHIKQIRSGKLSFNDLINSGIVEYITSGEQKNCMWSDSLDTFNENISNPLMAFTHCIIPITIAGLAALGCPFANHSQVTRTTFLTNQIRQTCSIYNLNYPHRFDKGTIVTLYNEFPAVPTFINQYFPPTGQNAVIGLLAHYGFNQEDSLTQNKSSSDWGWQMCLLFDLVKTEASRGQQFRTPNESITSEMNRSEYDYSHLDSTGCIKIGSIINNPNTIVIGKVEVKEDIRSEKKFVDQSVSIGESGECRIVDIHKGINKDSNSFVQVKYQQLLKENAGDKNSPRSAQKGMISVQFNNSEMPVSANGLPICVCMNPESMPTRMTINQLIETVVGKIAALTATRIDGTMFNKFDMNNISIKLEELGFWGDGTEPCYDGMTGRRIDVGVFMGIVNYQRLMKFASTEIYAIGSVGSTNAITWQPGSGRTVDGGMRMGEMEKDVMFSHGAGHFLIDKFRNDSDKFEVYICNTCGTYPIVNENQNQKIYRCQVCMKQKTNPEIRKVDSTWSSKYFTQQMNCCMVGVKFSTSKLIHEVVRTPPPAE